MMQLAFLGLAGLWIWLILWEKKRFYARGPYICDVVPHEWESRRWGRDRCARCGDRRPDA